MLKVYFEENGKQVKEALSLKIASIDQKAKELTSAMSKFINFLDKKKEALAKVEEQYSARIAEKERLLKPIDKKLRELQEQANNIRVQCDKDVQKILNKKVEEFKDSFSTLDSLIAKIDLSVPDGVIRIGAPSNDGSSIFYSTGTGTISGSSSGTINGDPLSLSYAQSYITEPIYFSINSSNPIHHIIQSLRTMVMSYSNRVVLLQKKLKTLQEEKSKCQFIQDNIDPDRYQDFTYEELLELGFDLKKKAW